MSKKVLFETIQFGMTEVFFYTVKSKNSSILDNSV